MRFWCAYFPFGASNIFEGTGHIYELHSIHTSTEYLHLRIQKEHIRFLHSK